jgi:hypothetical protein
LVSTGCDTFETVSALAIRGDDDQRAAHSPKLNGHAGQRASSLVSNGAYNAGRLRKDRARRQPDKAGQRRNPSHYEESTGRAAFEMCGTLSRHPVLFRSVA